MVGFMRWAHKRTFAFLLSVLVPSTIGVVYLSAQTVEPIVEISATKKIHCFNNEMLLVLTTSDVVCPAEFVSLGDAPLTESRTATGEVIELNPLLSARFAMAQSFAEADGIKLTLTSGFRSLERQQMLFDREVAIRGSETEAAKWVLPPQFSHHPQGLAIDVNYPGDRAGALWLERNGARFGLCRVYANEWWHFEGVIAPGQRCPAMAPNALIDIE
jgi:D-alanyl-D-alanine carboxypeptidase